MNIIYMYLKIYAQANWDEKGLNHSLWDVSPHINSPLVYFLFSYNIIKIPLPPRPPKVITNLKSYLQKIFNLDKNKSNTWSYYRKNQILPLQENSIMFLVSWKCCNLTWKMWKCNGKAIFNSKEDKDGKDISKFKDPGRDALSPDPFWHKIHTSGVKIRSVFKNFIFIS